MESAIIMGIAALIVFGFIELIRKVTNPKRKKDNTHNKNFTQTSKTTSQTDYNNLDKNFTKVSKVANQIKHENIDKSFTQACQLVNEGHNDEAFEIFTFIINTSKNTIKDKSYLGLTNYFLGNIYLERRNISKSKECYEYFIKNRVDIYDDTYRIYLGIAYYNLGGIYFIENDIYRAKKYKKKAQKRIIDTSSLDIFIFKGYKDL